ncbi:MAG TPA: peptidylprolyl isomerase [Bryobacteraceae bacterium]|jgi:hypothetical protein|nr:peptidylprolyl isomerase [Bryobacteraceae bacterium]
MKAISCFAILCASLAWSQTTPPPSAPAPDPNTVVATFPEDGSKLTLGDFQALIPLLSETYQPVAQRDPDKFYRLLALFKHAAAAADKEKLTELPPYKQGLDFAILEAKARFYVQQLQLSITISDDELAKYYEEHKEPFRRIKVSGIKVAFGAPEGEAAASTANASRVPKKILTEEEAKAKAEKIVADIRGGADFGKLVQTESDDETSKAKGGDLGVWKMTDNVPDVLRKAVMGLDQGQVSEPIKQPGCYYIVHADAVTYAPLSEIKDILFDQLKREKAGNLLKELYDGVKVEIPKGDQAPAPSEPKK